MATIHVFSRKGSAAERARDPNTHGPNANQGRGPKPRQVDGAGVVWAVIAGLAIWCILAAVRPMWALLVQVLRG